MKMPVRFAGSAVSHPASVLTVGVPDEEQSRLEGILRQGGFHVAHACTPVQAGDVITSTPVGVVLAESDLPGGSWLQILDDLHRRSEPASLIVMSRLADDSLWAEVLNRGGYDVLAKPLDREEVTRVVGAALRHFEAERQRHRDLPRVLAAAS